MKLRLILTILSFGLLAACGGGGGGEEPADKYVGNWKSVCYPFTTTTGATSYTIQYLDFTKASAGELVGKAVYLNEYSDGACTKVVWTGRDEYARTLKVGNATTFLNKPAELIVLTVGSQSLPGYAAVENNQFNLVVYTPGGNLPASWGAASPFTKQ
jgi:hypothetical protein